MHIGYARVSNADQSCNLQNDALTKSGSEKIFSDIASGAKIERKGLNDAINYMRPGDTLVVWRLDRLGRTLSSLISFVNELNNKQLCFKSIVENIDTTSPTGKFFFHVTGAFAELERNIIKERTKAGLAAARSRGRLGGRPKAVSPDKIKAAIALYNKNESSISDICKLLNISERSFYRYRKYL
ncbi:recombinase family protein [Fluviispira sanaruensis]|uniref:Recombinase family protein n=1 Tax=Fluviispira sanaruensis TaxID=2493639 RepID=A0A4P2VJ02_FLUSA|nr:recombinase family protein [Fluviispira sanaruensis]BBH53096.1 recombinase family protein [Fluviispira sanaruensis]